MAGNVDRAIILVVLPLNALMRDQISKLTKVMVQGRSVQVEDSRGGGYQTSLLYLFIRRSVWMIAVLFHY